MVTLKVLSLLVCTMCSMNVFCRGGGDRYWGCSYGWPDHGGTQSCFQVLSYKVDTEPWFFIRIFDDIGEGFISVPRMRVSELNPMAMLLPNFLIFSGDSERNWWGVHRWGTGRSNCRGDSLNSLRTHWSKNCLQIDSDKSTTIDFTEFVKIMTFWFLLCLLLEKNKCVIVQQSFQIMKANWPWK